MIESKKDSYGSLITQYKDNVYMKNGELYSDDPYPSLKLKRDRKSVSIDINKQLAKIWSEKYKNKQFSRLAELDAIRQRIEVFKNEVDILLENAMSVCDQIIDCEDLFQAQLHAKFLKKELELKK